jgi:hypothetical protein
MASSETPGTPAAPAGASHAKPVRKGLGTLKKVAILLVAAPILLFAAYTWLTLHWSYSRGSRAGFVQKFSERGWVCKTWEGELAIVNMPGSLQQVFPFTVRDEAVVKKINAAMGKRVALTYEQHQGVPTSCFGETGYFVVDVVEIGP